MYRQGDILIVKWGSIPVNAKPRNTLVVMHGEATGHSHKLEPSAGSEATIYDAPIGNDIFLSLSNETPLTHDEHNTINIPEGTYRVIRQREYDEKEIRYVVD